MKQDFRKGALKRAVGGVLLLLWLNVLALAALPQLHTHFHADAGTTQHQCAVTAVTQGEVALDVPAPVVAVVPPAVVLEPSPVVTFVLPSVSYLRAPGRAPPVA